MSSTGGVQSVPSRRQKRMGPAPFASFEDLSDELESPEESTDGASLVRLPGIREVIKMCIFSFQLESPEESTDGASLVRLPGIREDVTPSTPVSQGRITPEFVYTGISLVGAPSTPPSSTAMSSVSTPPSSTKVSLQTPSTPRIDISRASSSSHHEDSRDSTPERELFEGHDPERAKLGLGFREEGTLDLRSSTEELDFQETQQKMKKVNVQTPSQEEFHNHQRKDSQSSEIGLLSISGRTSRLSSIGSQGSTHSRMSNASHLSVISGQSGVSRSPSPHKMLLETSFCGTKAHGAGQRGGEKHGAKSEPEDLEIVLLSRKADPTKAILAEGINVDTAKPERKLVKQVQEKPIIKKENVQTVKPNIKITVDKPSIVSSDDRPKLPKTIISASGIEYTYIPLKGPLPIDDKPSKQQEITKPKSLTTKPTTTTGKTPSGKQKSSSAKSARDKVQSPSILKELREEEPKYIRIKLKPDHMYDDFDATNVEVQKPASLDLNDVNKRSIQSFKEILQTESKVPEKVTATKPAENQGRSISSTPSASPKFSRHSVLKEPVASSKSPSPSLSRKSSFASIFRSKEAILSPESPTIPSSSTRRKNTLTGIIKDASENLRERRRSRSKSRDRDRNNLSLAPSSTESIDSKGKQKTVFSLFKSKKERKSESDSNSSDVIPNVDVLTNVEFKFKPEPTSSQKSTKIYNETQLEGDSIRIPLHSPTYYEQRSLLQELRSSSQGSQETVIEANISKEAEASPALDSGPVQKTKAEQLRQSSTSSENIVFSTRLGSNNELFTTKLPKEKLIEKSPVTAEAQKSDVVVVENVISKQTSVTDGIGDSLPPTVNTETKPIEKTLTTTISSYSITPEDKIQEQYKDKSLSTEKVEVSKSNRNSMMSSVNDDDHYSSESERGSEIDFLKEKKNMELKLDTNVVEPVEMERKGLVIQQDSFEDELPYVPTTLPLERSVAVPIIPVKQRNVLEMKVFPIERPRSTTPINPSCLEEYCEEIVGSVHVEQVQKNIEKLKISLPREDSIKSPRKSTGNTNWLEFAEKKIATQPRRASLPQESETMTTTTPPPLPPKGIQKEWINFEEIPERRKQPKRIQTIPSRGNIDVPESVLQDNVVYSYVNPEDCKCECHEFNARSRSKENQRRDAGGEPVHEDELPLLEEDAPKENQRRDAGGEPVHEDELPLLEEDAPYEEKPANESIERIKLDVTILDRRSVISDSSVDLSTSIEHAVEANGVDCLQTPFTSDLGVSSNRSSIISQDDTQSPDRSPNAFPKTSS
ncbi:hypothetical protein QE152_g197 [Popillia japonica]|uniref:Uncharacterized protein n=1 Tax=Popillia japonica TaxID=7064 RepID=A0AAW1NKL6_POPJA